MIKRWKARDIPRKRKKFLSKLGTRDMEIKKEELIKRNKKYLKRAKMFNEKISSSIKVLKQLRKEKEATTNPIKKRELEKRIKNLYSHSKLLVNFAKKETLDIGQYNRSKIEQFGGEVSGAILAHKLKSPTFNSHFRMYDHLINFALNPGERKTVKKTLERMKRPSDKIFYSYKKNKKGVDRLIKETEKNIELYLKPHKIEGVNLNEIKKFIETRSLPNVKLTFKGPKGIKMDSQFVGNLHQVREALTRVIENAVELGATKIDTSLGFSGNKFHIKIKNNNTYIPESRRNKIFQYGYTKRKRGTGIGLYEAKKLIEDKFGGRIVVRSNKTKNTTTFEFVLQPKKVKR